MKMRRLTISSLKAHKGRLTLTLVAITLSVSFVTASFVLADSLRSVFNDVSSQIYAEVDAEVRSGVGDFDRIESGERFDEAAIASISAIDGVEDVVPSLGAEFTLFTIDAAGETLRPQGPPVLAFSVEGASTDPAVLSEASPFTLIEGATAGPGEVMLDTAQAAELGVTIGDAVQVATPAGPESFTLSGTVVFGDAESGVSPYFLLFDLDTMQRLIDAPGLIDGAGVLLSAGADPASTLAAIEASLPTNLLLADQEQLIAEQNDEFGQIIDIIQIALLVFAGITTFVAIFVIANTFAVLVGQQMRQLGLLRAIGATSRQAGTVIVAEAALVGAIASALGLGLGLLTAEGITLLFESVTTGGFPEGPLELAPRTIVFALIVGIGVTVLSALIPARRAARTTPMQALQESVAVEPTRRSLLGGALSVFALPFGRMFGTSGRLASMNVKRNPRRVLSTAASMIVGLALITGMSVMAASYRTTLTDAMTSDFNADLIITGVDGGDFPFATMDELAAIDGVEAASGFGATEVRHDGQVIAVASFQAAAANDVLDLGVSDGALPQSVDEGAVSDGFATEHGLAVGDAASFEFSDGAVVDLTVSAVFTDDSVVASDVLIDESVVAAHARNIDASLGALRFASDADITSVQTAVEAVLQQFPQAEQQTVDGFLEARQAQVDQLLILANALLGLTIIIAMSGIANTVALSVLERTHEIGLLRSVGMSRRQVRSMIRHEAFITSTVGAVLGVGLGVLIAGLGSTMIPSSFIAELVIPGGQIVTYLVVGIALGLIAAIIPAFRASRLNLVTSMRAA